MKSITSPSPNEHGTTTTVEAMTTKTESTKTHASVTTATSSLSCTKPSSTPSTMSPPFSQSSFTPIANPYLSQSIVTPSSTTNSPTFPPSTLSIAHSDTTKVSTTHPTDTKANFESKCQTLDNVIKALCDAPETSGALFVSGTSNNTASYALSKKKLLVEFIEVMQEKGEKYAYLLVTTKGSVCDPSFCKVTKLPIV